MGIEWESSKKQSGIRMGTDWEQNGNRGQHSGNILET